MSVHVFLTDGALLRPLYLDSDPPVPTKSEFSQLTPYRTYTGAH